MPKLSEKLLIYRIFLCRSDLLKDLQRVFKVSDEDLKQAILEKIRSGKIAFPKEVKIEHIVKDVVSRFWSLVRTSCVPGCEKDKIEALVGLCVESYYISVLRKKSPRFIVKVIKVTSRLRRFLEAYEELLKKELV